ncbi:tryptophanase/L-cysteine desulfhydrase, PLP-dependent [Haloarcula vallismortis ATCC 29715]|uniref:Tryptophanase/L-cysteine desulfhydrase, PLP-dependent n=2 Tax=Haloarcula vallismortis TaxID=28442 RepID=M0JMM6_HALVA|nr:tryptophanase/L-cysteine desulfhydrase, PLP-dependent [Haloarcula vallismortis ATCC 29715]
MGDKSVGVLRHSMRSYKAKSVTSIQLQPRERRETALGEAGHNVFNLAAEDVFIDLLTDSGTGAMSDEQWADVVRGDEAYAGSRSFERFHETVADVMGFDRVVPTHQGRGAENVLFGALLDDGDVVLNNTHFDTTRAHVTNQGATAVDCPAETDLTTDSVGTFAGNFSTDRGWDAVEEYGRDAVSAVVLTITNNSAAGQPVSMENIRETAAFATEIDATFVIDACRFAENAQFIKQRDPEYADTPLSEIAREQLRSADAITMSGKKDALANIGGFTAVRDAALFEQCKQRAILYEGFPTYGGLAGRDLEAMATGLREAVEPPYVAERIEQVATLGDLLRDRDIPIVTPTGGHAVYMDAAALFPDIPAEQFPGQRLVCELYREGGVRTVELGSFAFPGTDRPELVRLALPRRTYWREHLEHIAETAARVRDRRDEYTGLKIVWEPPMDELRHFSAELEPVA